jgi:uncharacterized protein YutE (UPF0331/DUF86 family)
VTDPAIVLRKLAALREHAARLARRRPATAEELRDDVDLQDALAMSLLVAVQAALDIALHIVSDEGLGVPATYAEGFQKLRDAAIVDRETSDGLGRMAALRNRIAHGYAGVDFERIWGELPQGLAALASFQTALARHLDRN